MTPLFLELGYLEAPFRKWHKKIFQAGVAQCSLACLSLPVLPGTGSPSLPCAGHPCPEQCPAGFGVTRSLSEVSLPLVVQAALTARGRFGCAPSEPGQAGGQRWDRLLGSVADPVGNVLCALAAPAPHWAGWCDSFCPTPRTVVPGWERGCISTSAPSAALNGYSPLLLAGPARSRPLASAELGL